jgi:hypothetical protein
MAEPLGEKSQSMHLGWLQWCWTKDQELGRRLCLSVHSRAVVDHENIMGAIGRLQSQYLIGILHFMHWIE